MLQFQDLFIPFAKFQFFSKIIYNPCNCKNQDIISPIIYSNWEIANTWQIKTSKYSCDLIKTAHLVAISWTLADIHGQWMRRSFTHTSIQHTTQPTPPTPPKKKNIQICTSIANVFPPHKKIYIKVKKPDLHIYCKFISTFTFYLICKEN